jgi:PhnB protein
MPLQETFWGAYFGSLRDRFGIGWILNHELSPPG